MSTTSLREDASDNAAPALQAAPPAQGAAQPTRPNASGRILLALGMVALSLIAGYGGAKFAMRDLEVEMTLRPRVAVVDFQRMATTLNGQPKEILDRAMGQVRGNVSKLVAAGFVVIDGQGVLGAPNEAYVPAFVGFGVAGGQ